MADFDLGGFDFGGAVDLGGSDMNALANTLAAGNYNFDPSSIGPLPGLGETFNANAINPAGYNFTSPGGPGPGVTPNLDPSGYSLGAGGGVGGGGGGGLDLGKWGTGALKFLGLDNATTLPGILKGAAPLAQLGMTGVGLARMGQAAAQQGQQQKILDTAQKTEQAIARPAAHYAETILPAAESAMLGGPLPPGLQAQVDQWKQQQTAKFRDYFARAGIDDSTMMKEVDGWVEQQSLILAQQLAQNLATSGMEAVGTALGPADAAGKSAVQQMGTTGKAISDASAAIARLLGMATEDEKKTQAQGAGY
jgi:hypothetical protein